MGLDACPGGWVAVELVGGRFAEARFGTTLRELLAATPAAVVGVDMPLGLLSRGWRAADIETRATLGPRRASVFLVPPRPVWAEPDFAAANRRCRELTGAGLTRQAWGLRAKLLEADTVRATDPARLFEVHPEAAFRTMAGAPLASSKTTWAGMAHRRALLRAAGILLPDDLGPANPVPPVDVLDAAAVAWSARRIALGTGRRLPARDQLDDRGDPIAIWF
jgi:predicted RNase H-like nuclease